MSCASNSSGGTRRVLSGSQIARARGCAFALLRERSLEKRGKGGLVCANLETFLVLIVEFGINDDWSTCRNKPELVRSLAKTPLCRFDAGFRRCDALGLLCCSHPCVRSDTEATCRCVPCPHKRTRPCNIEERKYTMTQGVREPPRSCLLFYV